MNPFGNNKEQLSDIEKQLIQIRGQLDRIEKQKNGVVLPVEYETPPIVEKEVTSNLNGEQLLLDKVKESETLRKILLSGKENELLELIVKVSQWDNILLIWDELAEKCKKSNSVTEEVEILKECLKLHNYQWNGEQKPSLTEVAIDADYNYKEHQQVVNFTGNKVKEVLLQGLVNAGGDLIKKPLVVTT